MFATQVRAAAILAAAIVVAEVSAQTQSQPATVESGKITLTPQNTLIQFTGTHVGDDPNPRVGVFQEFAGTAEVNEGRLIKVAVTIETASLETPISNLTNHLKSPDFFDAREYPRAKFVSTKIKPESGGQYTITGDLTLLAKTNEISFPAKVEIDESGLTLTAALTLDRTQFGMDKMTERVNKEIALEVAIGKVSKLPAAGAAPPAGEPRRWDPEAMFNRRDADGDGQWTAEEIPARVQENLTAFDTNGDGSVSQAEFQERMKEFAGRRREPDASGRRLGQSPPAGQ